MQTRITIAQVGSDAPAGVAPRRLGPAAAVSAVDILNGFARDFSTYEGDGAFSIKWIPKGAARYAVDRIQHYLGGDKVLVLEAGPPYEIEFLDRKGTESFCIFFSEPLVRQARAERQCDDLSSAPGGSSREADLPFADIVFRPPAALGAALRGLRQAIGDPATTPMLFEEAALSLLDDATAIADGHRRLVERVPGRRADTRRRRLARLQRAKEMIEDHEGRPPGLDELAAACSLSKFHFLRLFTGTFGVTPMAYADRCRVERAKELLRRSRLTIGQTAERLGFESQSAFAKMFRRHAGVAPRVFKGR